MNKTVGAAIDKLSSAPSNVAPFAVQNVFQALESSRSSPREIGVAFKACVDCDDKEAVEVALGGLARLVSRKVIFIEDAIEILLANFYSAGVSCAPSIISTLTAFAQMEPRSSASKQLWVQHPLTRAMIARPDTAPEVLSSAIRLILSSASDGQTAQKCIAFLYPCLSYILLAPSLGETEGSQSSAPVLASSLHSQLVRLACSKPVLQGALLDILVVHLRMHRAQLASIRAWLLPALADCVDAIECLEDEDSARSVILHCIQALVSMAQDMAEQGLPLSHVITALARLQTLEDSESCLVCFVWELGLLSMQAAGQDKGYCLALLTGILAAEAPLVATEAACRMLTMCALSATVHAVPVIRAQGATLLQSVQQLESASSSSSEIPTVGMTTTLPQGFYGDQALVSQARTVLECLLASPGRAETEMEACQWLAALHASLDRGSDCEVLQGTPSQGRWSPLLLKDINTEPKIFSLPLMVVLTALLGHSSFKVQASAGRALGAAAKAFPLCGPTLLSSLLFNIKRAVERLCSGAIPAGTEISAAQTCLVLLSVVPSLATSQAATGAVLAALKPLTAAGTESDNLRCIAMRLLLAAWQESGRAWPAIRALLLPSSQAESKVLRLTRAACVRDVCKTNGNHGTELVKPVEEALKDSNPGVVALGLEALAHLCESDHLDFYAAWKVVVRILPTLPTIPLVASKWIALLAYGALDAMVYPEAAVAVLELLWSASNHSSISVRQQAYLALSRFPILLLENLEIDYTLQDYTSPLLSEAADLTVAAVEDLAGKALAYEHSRRRRQVEGGQGGRRAAMAAGSLMHRMTRALPRQLCEAKSGSTFGPSPGALLLCFLPKGAPERQKPADGPRDRNAVPAQQLLDGYVQVFRDVCSTGIAGAGSFEARHVCLMIESWTQFLARWMLAAKSVKADELAKQQGAQTVTALHVSAIAANEVWEEIQRVWKMEDIIASESAALAAGSLAAWLGPQHPSIVSECVKCLQRQLQSARRPSSQRVACAALGAAITGLHPTEWQSWISAADVLKEKIMSPAGEGSVIAAAAEALGAMVGALDAHACVPGEEPSERCLRETSAVGESITLILRELDTILQSSANSIIQSALAAAPSAWATHVGSTPSNATACALEVEQTGTAVTGLWRAVSLMTPAIWRQGGSSFLLTLLRGLTGHIKLTIGSVDQGEAKPVDTWCLVGAVGALPLLCEPLLKGELIDEMEVRNVISALCCALKNKDLGMTSVGSRLLGSVSEVLGEIAALLIDCGIPEDVDDIAELLVNGLQAPNSALQASAAMGCAAFLGAPVLACAVGHRRQPRQHLIVSSSEQESSKMKSMLSSLEDIALKGTEPRGRRAAAWAAAMLCAHARRELRIGVDVSQEQKPSDGSAREEIPESTHLPLHALPQDGAMFALVSYLNKGIQATSFEGMACAPGVLRCLARADRLPVMHWGGVCRKLMRTATVIAASNTELPEAAKLKQEVRAAAAQLLLKHGHRTNLGLGELVEELIEQQRFESLEESLKVELLSALPALLASLSEERALLVISALPALTATSFGTGVELAAWNGLSACCVVKGLGSAQLPTHDSQHGGGHSQQYSALTQTMSAMFRRLPGIPKWHAGEWKAAGGCVEGSLNSRLWDAAFNCLSNVPSHTALAILPMSTNQGHDGPSDARSAFMRSQLAQRGKLPHREMSVCKNFCIDGPSSDVRTCVLAVASAFISAPQAVQEQNFRDALATVSHCSQPLQALELVACMAAVMASSAQAGVLSLGVKVLSSYSTEAALQTMPHNLPALLSHKLWQPSIEVISEQLLAILRSTEGPMDNTFHSLADPMITSCLLAIRQHLQSDCWQFLAVTAS